MKCARCHWKTVGGVRPREVTLLLLLSGTYRKDDPEPGARCCIPLQQGNWKLRAHLVLSIGNSLDSEGIHVIKHGQQMCTWRLGLGSSDRDGSLRMLHTTHSARMLGLFKCSVL